MLQLDNINSNKLQIKNINKNSKKITAKNNLKNQNFQHRNYEKNDMYSKDLLSLCFKTVKRFHK